MEKGVDYTGVTVVFLCHDGQGNYVFSKRGKNCRDEQGRWDPGGGALEFGEKVEERLKQEIKEEYGADVLQYEEIGFLDVHRVKEEQLTHWIALLYLVLVDHEQVKNGEPHKFDEVGWFRLDNLPTPMHSQFAAVIEKYKDKLV